MITDIEKYYVTGILVAPLIGRVGNRRLVQVSGVIALVGYLASAMSSSIFLLYVTYGVVAGGCTAVTSFAASYIVL